MVIAVPACVSFAASSDANIHFLQLQQALKVRQLVSRLCRQQRTGPAKKCILSAGVLLLSRLCSQQCTGPAKNCILSCRCPTAAKVVKDWTGLAVTNRCVECERHHAGVMKEAALGAGGTRSTTY